MINLLLSQKCLKMFLYLAGLRHERDISLNPERPVPMQQVFIKLHKEDDEDEEGIKHEESKDHFIPEFFEFCRHTSLLFFVVVQGEEVLLDEVLPEGHLGGGEVLNLPSAKVLVLDPVRVDQVVSFLLGLCWKI